MSYNRSMRPTDRFIRRALPALAAGALLFAACGDDDADTSAQDTTSESTSADDTTANSEPEAGDAASGAAVTIFDFAYDPPELTAAAGAEITFTNDDETAHTATASDGAFDSGSIAAGAEGTVTAPDEPGEYPYICSFHPFMKGTLVVE